MKRRLIIEQIAASKTLPILDRSSLAIMELLDKGDLYPQQIVAVINTDPLLASQMLKMANSAFFRRLQPINELLHAIAILGVDLAVNVALSFAMQSSLKNKKTKKTFDENMFWKKSIIAGWIALGFKDQVKNISCGHLYMASMLQDIGIFAMSHIVGDKYDRIYSMTKSHLDLIEIERRNFDIDHAEVGALLIESWGLPNSITMAIRQSHDLIYSKLDVNKLNYLVSISGMIADDWLTDGENFSMKSITNALVFSTKEFNDAIYNTLDDIPTVAKMYKIDLLSECRLSELKTYYSDHEILKAAACQSK